MSLAFYKGLGRGIFAYSGILQHILEFNSIFWNSIAHPGILFLWDVVLDPSLHFMAVDVVFKHSLLHGVTDEGAEGADSVALLMGLQLILCDARESLLAVLTLQAQLLQGKEGGGGEDGGQMRCGD